MSKISYPSLNGKFLLVTGATSGIGRGICEELLEQEAIVVGIGRDSSKLDKAILNNQNFNFLEFDLTNIDLIEEELNSCVKEFGKFDGFVSCAGKEETMPLNGYKTQKIKSIFEINLFSSIEILRVLSKKKNSNPNASIVFMSSVMGELGQ